MFNKFLKATSLICSMVIMIELAKSVQVDPALTNVKTTATAHERNGVSTIYNSKGKL